ncbi:GDSL-like Lipase/Acylhydrolase [compost metagenome]
MLKNFLIALAISSIGSVALAQKAPIPFFKDGQTVSFVGNSITHAGDFHHFIALYYATRFPNEKITFNNLGIRGDNTYSFLKRMDIDILQKKSDWYVVMAGMNDVNRLLYNADRQSDPEVQKQKQWALNDYKKNYEKVIQRLMLTGAKVILQKPSIYDQTGDLPTPNQLGVNDALLKCTEIIDELAKKYKLQVIDYFSLMSDINKKIQIIDPKKTIVGNDRVHPNLPGHFVMAYQFLKSTAAPNYVSAIELQKGKLKNAVNANVNDIVWKNEVISFTATENSLPFPIPTAAEPALNWVNFNEELNVQLLKVSPLAAGNYALNIDGIMIGNFSSEDLQKGINLATIKTTPQYLQAQKVAEKTIAYRNVQRKLRDLKFVVYSYFPKHSWSADLATSQKVIDSLLTSLQTTNEKKYKSLQPQFESYLKDKPKQEEWEKKAGLLINEIYQINRPTLHSYLIKKE